MLTHPPPRGATAHVQPGPVVWQLHLALNPPTARSPRESPGTFVEPHDGGTRYTWSMEIIPTVAGGRFLAPFFCRFMRMNARKQQERFKRVMERDDRPATERQ